MIVLCLCASVAGYAQDTPAIEQQRGTIDPLFENFKSPRRNYDDSFKNLSAGDAFQHQRNAVSPSAGELDPSVNVNIFSTPGNVQTTAVQPDGKILVAGFFRTVNDVRRKSIVRLNADFSLDTTFFAEVNGTILTVARQTDGKIIISGAFTVVSGASRNRIARLNSDGSLDATFNPGAGADALVYDVAIQTDGKILLGGNFARVNSVNNYAVTRLNTDGSADVSFTSPIPAPPPSSNPTLPGPIPSLVYSIALQTDGKIFIAGFIVKSYNPSLVATPIARLNQNGTFDATFDPGTINSNALKVVVQPDGKILLVGYFNTINGVNRNYIVRFNTDGSLDTSFNIGTGANSPILTAAVQPDGKILISGFFNSFNGTNRQSVARLNADGTLDMSFDTGNGFSLRGTIKSITPLPGGKVFVGGSFVGGFNIGGDSSDSIKVFNADGSNDSSIRFNTTALGGVRAIAVQPDGKILVGGNFNRPGSGSLNHIFRLNPDGSLDTDFGPSLPSFSSSSNGQINSIIVQSDGKIIVAGSNVTVSFGGSILFGTSIARLNPDGTPDGSFVAGNIPIGFDGINAAALQPDGKIVIVWGTLSRGVSFGGIARLNSNGSVDTTFTNLFPAAIYESVVIQPDGKILVGGAFSVAFVSTHTESVFYNGVVRLNADGSRDASFVPATSSVFETGRVTEVNSVALQVNGKILIGGRIFTNTISPVSGAVRLNADGTLDTTFNAGAISSGGDIARVENILPQPNGKILIGGFFDRLGTTARNNVARLNADGSVDNTFTAATDNTVYKIATQRGGKVLIGGDFEVVNGTFRTSLARLLSEPVAERPLFDFDGDGKSDISVFRPGGGGVWYLLNSASGFTSAQFGAADDKIVPADYDGDGRTDLAVYRAGVWYLQRSSAGFTGIGFGAPDDIPLPADFDGDGRADLVIWRPSNGTWNVLNIVSGQFKSFQFRASGDKPIAADFDGDGVADYAVYRPSNGVWYLQRSRLGFTAVQFGSSTDVPVAADYDGDGSTDIAVYRPSNGVWYRLNSSNGGFAATQFGIATDLPAPADYDGDGKTDIAVFRNGTWYVQQSTNGFTGVQFGADTDKPVPNAYIR